MGRIASNFYISYETIETINDTEGPVKLTQMLTDDVILDLISSANEFTQIKVYQYQLSTKFHRFYRYQVYRHHRYQTLFSFLNLH